MGKTSDFSDRGHGFDSWLRNCCKVPHVARCSQEKEAKYNHSTLLSIVWILFIFFFLNLINLFILHYFTLQYYIGFAIH